MMYRRTHHYYYDIHVLYDDIPVAYTGWLVLSIALDVALLCSLLTVLIGSGMVYPPTRSSYSRRGDTMIPASIQSM